MALLRGRPLAHGLRSTGRPAPPGGTLTAQGHPRGDLPGRRRRARTSCHASLNRADPSRARRPPILHGSPESRRSRLHNLSGSQLGQCRPSYLRIEQRHALPLIEVAGEPAQRRTLDLRRLISGVQQHEPERLFEAERELAGGRLGGHDVPPFDCSLADRSRMSLRCQRPSRWGRTARTA